MPISSLEAKYVNPLFSPLADKHVNPRLHKFGEYRKNSATGWCGKHVLVRGVALGGAGLYAVCTSVDTIRGLFFGVGAVLTAGLHSSTYFQAMDCLFGSRYVVAQTYLFLLKAVNPDCASSKNCFIKSLGNGLISDVVDEKFNNFSSQCDKSSNFFVRHVVSRLTYLLRLPAKVITRVVDGVLGVLGMVFSFLTLGKITFFNHLAYRGLQAPGLIQDVFDCVIKCLNPRAGSEVKDTR